MLLSQLAAKPQLSLRASVGFRFPRGLVCTRATLRQYRKQSFSGRRPFGLLLPWPARSHTCTWLCAGLCVAFRGRPRGRFQTMALWSCFPVPTLPPTNGFDTLPLTVIPQFLGSRPPIGKFLTDPLAPSGCSRQSSYGATSTGTPEGSRASAASTSPDACCPINLGRGVTSLLERPQRSCAGVPVPASWRGFSYSHFRS